MNQHYAAGALRAGHRCEYCYAPEVVFNFPFEVEHIIPLAHGGADTATNWALACRSCNLWKAAHLDGVDPETGTLVRLYDPRTDPWEIHFHVDRELGEIHGITSTGRVTVLRLQMNHPAHRAARTQWMRLGLFP